MQEVTHLKFDYSPLVAQTIGLDKPQPRADVAMTFSRSRMAARRRSIAGQWARLLDSLIKPNVIIGSIGILAAAVFVLVLAALFTPHPQPAAASPVVISGLANRDRVFVSPLRKPVEVATTATPDSAPAIVVVPTSKPTQAPIALPKWITADCIYRMEVIIEGEVGGVDDQQTRDFVAVQVLYTAIRSQCGYGSSVKGSLENVWFGYRRYANTGTAIVLSAQTSHAIDQALFNFSLPIYPECLYTGNASDVFGVWLKWDSTISIDVALPAYPKAPQVFGLNCSARGK